MLILLYITGLIALISTVMVITRANAVHALLYLVVSLFSVAVIFALLGAPFIAALEILIYAGAIMVLFIFVIMMLNLGGDAKAREKQWIQNKSWVIPGIFSLILLAELVYILGDVPKTNVVKGISPKDVAVSLFRNYLPVVELAGFLLMAGIVGAFHLGRRENKILHRYLEKEQNDA